MKKLAVIFLFGAASLCLTADPWLIKLANCVIDPSSPNVAGLETLESSPTAEGQYQFIVQLEK